MFSTIFLFLAVVIWAAALVVVACGLGGLSDDYRLFRKVRDDDFETRFKEACKQNENFVELMRAADDKLSDGAESPTKTLLDEARDNLKNSYDLRSQENQSMLSMTAVVLGMFSALIYFSKQLVYVENVGLFALFATLSVMALACLVFAMVLLLNSFSITYKMPDSADKGIQNILDGKDCDGNESAEIKSRPLASEVKYQLISASSARSFANSESNKLKSRCWAASRKYMKIAGVFLLLMLLVAGAFKICVSPSGEMLRQLFGCCPCCF